jgi:hypothetical protein
VIFGLSYFRIGAYVVIAIIIGYLIYQYRTGQEAKHQVSVITAERDKAIADHNAYIAIRAAQDSITAKVSTDYENAITDLVGQLNAARDANNHIRLCHTMPKANAPSTATSLMKPAKTDQIERLNKWCQQANCTK